MSAVITPFEGTELFNTASFNNRISQINTGFSYVSNPNLLDNWYFGRPVDQRKGYIQIGGTMMYKDAACTDQFGPSAGTTPVVVYATYARPIDNGVELGLYIPLNNIVRGYTGNGYTVDRWGILNNVTATLQNASLNIAYTESGWNLYTFLDNVLIPGTTYTLSCLYKASGNPIRLVCTWGTNKFFFNEQAPISDDWTLAEITGTIPADASIDINEIVVQSLGSGAGNFSLKAIKLEIGPTQTLAHREGDKWVLNEIPNFGEQLSRCKWYHQRIKASSSYMRFGVSTPYSSTSAGVFIPFSGEMRKIPVVSFGGNFALFDGQNFHSVTLSSDTLSPYNAILTASGSTQPTKAAQLLAYNDSTAYIDFSADL